MNGASNFLILVILVFFASCKTQEKNLHTHLSSKQTSYGPKGRIEKPLMDSTITTELIRKRPDIGFAETRSIEKKLTEQREATQTTRQQDQSYLETATNEVETTVKGQRKKPKNEAEDKQQKRADWSLILALTLYTPLVYFFFISIPLVFILGKKDENNERPLESKWAIGLTVVWIILVLFAIIWVVSLPAGGPIFSFM